MRGLKRGGVATFADPLAAKLVCLLSSLRGIGIFLVPLGELEEWLNEEGIKESKANKWAWANEAAMVIQTKGASAGDIWDFVREIGKYLSTQ